MQVLYTAEAIAVGDGRNGEVRSSDGVIDEILGRIKSGKEADVYLVVHRGQRPSWPGLMALMSAG